MAYRKTAKVTAALEARREAIVAAAADVVARHGFEALSTVTVAERAGISVGLVYKYFPDSREIWLAVVARALARDVAAIRAAAMAERYPLNALARSVEIFYGRLQEPRLVAALAGEADYAGAIRNELARLMKPALPDMLPVEQKRFAAGVFGACLGFFDVVGPTKRGADAARDFVLLGLGIPAATARRVGTL